jgi:hypothetical protein
MEIVNQIYSLLETGGLKTSIDNSIPLDVTIGNSPVLQFKDSTLLLESTDLAATTYYSSTIILDGYRNITLQGKLTGGITVTIETKLLSSDDWVDITKSGYELITNTINNSSFADVNFLLDFSNINVKFIRVKYITSDITNYIKLSYRLLY